ncbi:MAG: KilA-N domain-containing protein [Pseudomonadota bacterium]
MPNITTVTREFKGVKITQRTDGYLDATAMCKATGKRWPDYRRLDSTQAFIDALSSDVQIPTSEIIQSVKGGLPESQGTWVHPQVAINLAQWCSPEFAVLVSKWVFELLTTGRVDLQPQTPPQSTMSEVAETFKAYASICECIGVTGNQKAIAANAATIKHTGINPLENMGITHLSAESQEQTLTVSDIAKRLGIKPRQVNPILTKIGLQTANRDHKDRLYYELTNLGKEHGVYLDTGKKHKTDGSPVRQIKWYDSAIDLAKTHLETDFALTKSAA